MSGFTDHIEQYRIGFLGLALLILSAVFVSGGRLQMSSQALPMVFSGLLLCFGFLSFLFRSFTRALAPVLAVFASLALVHASAAVNGFSRESLEALFFLTLLSAGGTASRASAAVMTNVTRYGSVAPEKLPLKEIARYGLAAWLAGIVALGDIFFLADKPMMEVVSFTMVALAAPLFGFGTFFFLLVDGSEAGEEAVAHHNRLLRRAGAFETVGEAAATTREGLGLFLFMVPLIALIIAVWTQADAMALFAKDMLFVISGLFGVALFAGKSIRAALVMGLAISMYACLMGFILSTWNMAGRDPGVLYGALSASSAVLLPPLVYLYKLCEYHLLAGSRMRTVLMTAAVRGTAMFWLTWILFALGALPWILLGPVDTSWFAFLFVSFSAIGALFVPVFGMSLFSVVEMMFRRDELIKRTI